MSAEMSFVEGIVGRWHLVDPQADEIELPRHRVDLVMRRSDTGLAGAVLSRADSTEAATLVVQFDGSTLRLQMRDPRAPDRETPWLVMQPKANGFEGRWHNDDGQPMGPTLKLVRGRT